MAGRRSSPRREGRPRESIRKGGGLGKEESQEARKSREGGEPRREDGKGRRSREPRQEDGKRGGH